jgi:hypothetical protein
MASSNATAILSHAFMAATAGHRCSSHHPCGADIRMIIRAGAR